MVYYTKIKQSKKDWYFKLIDCAEDGILLVYES